MAYRIIELPPLTLRPNNFYLYYNEQGDILSLTNEKLSEGNYIEVSEKFVVDFVESKKEIKNFKVKISDRIQLEQKSVTVKNFYDLCVINKVSNSDSVNLLITVSKGSLTFKLNNFESSFIVNDKRIYKFFVTDSSNLNILKKSIELTLDNLKSGKKVKYNFDKNTDVIVTVKEFDSYGIIYDTKN
jgi:hypothetical protein